MTFLMDFWPLSNSVILQARDKLEYRNKRLTFRAIIIIFFNDIYHGIFSFLKTRKLEKLLNRTSFSIDRKYDINQSNDLMDLHHKDDEEMLLARFQLKAAIWAFTCYFMSCKERVYERGCVSWVGHTYIILVYLHLQSFIETSFQTILCWKVTQSEPKSIYLTFNFYSQEWPCGQII